MRLAHRQARLAVGLVLLACVMPSAAGASTRVAARDASFCSVAKSFALTLQKPPTTQSLAASQSVLKTNLGKLAAASGTLVAAAPRPLKHDLGTVLGLYGQLRTDLAKTNWNLAALAQSPATMGSLLAQVKQDTPSFARLKHYLSKTCHD